jgi:phospholipid-binding lipoprotein MlaA
MTCARHLAGALRRLCLLAMLASLAACASGPNANPLDPFEPFNRSVSRFNDELDRAVLKPVATGYKEAVPAFVRTSVSNFFNNISDVWSFINSMLQLKPVDAADNFLRVGVNTVFGMAGLIDFASAFNIERHKEDFGQTLGRWGVRSGPYLVLPGLGPSTVRDTLALGVEFGARADPVRRFTDVPLRNSLYGLRVVDKRANLLNAGQVLDAAALDRYTFTRDVFLQLRRREVDDGKDEEVDPYKDGPADSAPKSGVSPEAPAAGAAPAEQAKPFVVVPTSLATPPSSEPLEQGLTDASAAE